MYIEWYYQKHLKILLIGIKVMQLRTENLSKFLAESLPHQSFQDRIQQYENVLNTKYSEMVS